MTRRPRSHGRMERDRRAVRPTAALLLAGVLVSCSSTAPDPAPTGADTPSATLTTASVKPTPPVSPPTPEALPTPAATAGALSVHSFPTPDQLGAGWRYAVDPGSAEDGYLGNGTPAVSRDPAEVVRTAVPLGCRRPHPMARPTHALEVDYTYRGVTVIVIRSRFAGPAHARSFSAARAANLRVCEGHLAVPAEGVLVATVSSPSAGVLLSDRTPTSAPWSELAVVDGTDLVLVAAQTRIGTAPLTPANVHRLAVLLRR